MHTNEAYMCIFVNIDQNILYTWVKFCPVMQETRAFPENCVMQISNIYYLKWDDEVTFVLHTKVGAVKIVCELPAHLCFEGLLMWIAGEV